MIDQVEQREGWWWPKTDVRCWEYMKQHPDIPEIVASFVKESERKVVVQAGGNCGFYPRQYSQLFDQVYTFEPDWLNFYCLNLNVPEPNVHKIQSCLGERHNLISLKVKEINRGKNFVNGAGHCPTLTIDDLALTRCDAIQLDVEGFEYYVLKGAQQTVQQFHPVIVVEVWDQLSNRFEENINQQLESLLEQWGYQHHCTFYDSDRVYLYQP